MSDVIVVGAGFAGLWTALGAARRLDGLGVPADTVEATVLSAKPFTTHASATTMRISAHAAFLSVTSSIPFVLHTSPVR